MHIFYGSFNSPNSLNFALFLNDVVILKVKKIDGKFHFENFAEPGLQEKMEQLVLLQIDR